MVQDSKLSDSRERRPEIRSPTYGKLKNQQEHTHPVRWHGVRGICRPARVAALLVLCTCAVGAGRKRRRRDGGGGDASDGLSQGNASVVGDPAEAKPRAPPPPVLARPCKCPKETIWSRLHDMRAPRNRLAFGCARHAHSSEPDCLTTTATPTNPMRAPSLDSVGSVLRVAGRSGPRTMPIRWLTARAPPTIRGSPPTHTRICRRGRVACASRRARPGQPVATAPTRALFIGRAK